MMTTSTTFDRYMDRVAAGESLSADEIRELATTPDILPLGMLADTLRRQQHGTRVTFVRVATYSYESPFAEPIPAGALEVRLTGSPVDEGTAVAAVSRARAAAGKRTLSGLSWVDVERLSGGSRDRIASTLRALRAAGLDALAELPLDRMANRDAVLESLTTAGFEHLRLTIEKMPSSDRTELFIDAARLHQRFPVVHALNPLPMALATFRPTTGYEDVKAVAIARLAAPAVPTIQVDWLRYGPKLAQVALTFGADDLDGVSASDEAPEGRRRAPIEEIHRNIEAAGYAPYERDGWFVDIV